MKQLGVGIIGCGWVAEEHIKAFSSDSRSEVRALVSRNRTHAERYREQYHLSCSVSTAYSDMLKQEDVDIVVICTPHHVHTEQVVAACEAGKHILVEKPMALTVDDARRQVEAVKKYRVKSLVGFVLHWNPLLMAADGLLKSDTFGDVFMVEADYLHRIWMPVSEKWYASRKISGTALLTAGCHAIDALHWFAGSDAEEVSAYQVATDNPIEYPGTISVNIRFTDGKIGRSTTSFDCRMPYRFSIGIYGTKATLRNNKLFAPEQFHGQKDFMEIPCDLPDSGDVTHHPFQGEAAHLLDCIVEDRTPFPDCEDALQTHLICFAADLSAHEQRPVRLGEL